MKYTDIKSFLKESNLRVAEYKDWMYLVSGDRILAGVDPNVHFGMQRTDADEVEKKAIADFFRDHDLQSGDIHDSSNNFAHIDVNELEESVIAEALTLKTTPKQEQEIVDYLKGEKLEQYQNQVLRYLEDAEKRFKRYGYYVNSDQATKNMIKALRMSPWMNSGEDWARLHVTEYLMKLRKK